MLYLAWLQWQGIAFAPFVNNGRDYMHSYITTKRTLLAESMRLCRGITTLILSPAMPTK